MSIQPHHPPCCEDTPGEQRESRYPDVAYRALHHRLLETIEAGLVRFDDHAKSHLVNGHPVIRGIELGLARLAFTGRSVFGDKADSTMPVLLTPLGEAAKRRWDHEQGQVARSGGEA